MKTQQQRDWRWAHEGPQNEFAGAFARFRLALEKSWVSPSLGSAVTNAHLRYSEALQKQLQAEQFAQPVAEAYAAYHEELRAATNSPRSQTTLQKAFLQYVNELKTAWANIEPSEMSVADLLAIAQSLTWIATITADITADIGSP